MVTLPSKTYKSDEICLSQVFNSTTKENMLKACKKFDIYVSPNLRKDETAHRIAALIATSKEILGRLSKTELQILDEFVTGDNTTYVVRKQRKTPYILQKYYLVLTYCDEENNEWHMLMPSDIRQALSTDYKFYLDLAMQGKNAPSAKDIRMMAFLQELCVNRQKKTDL